MRRIYTLVLYLLVPFIIARLLWKSRCLPAYRRRISERFALDLKSYGKVDVWIHAVSLGEVIAATPLIDAFLKSKKIVMVTTMTPTGSERVIKHFGNKVSHSYIPYDLPFVLKRFFKKINPGKGVIFETELWPNLIHESTLAKMPLFLVNARISSKSFRSYQQISFFLKPLLNKFEAILAQSKEDAARFVSLGADKFRVHSVGNIKFDLQHAPLRDNDIYNLPDMWGCDRTVLIAASTHNGEENELLKILPRLRISIPNIILLIAPRHPERFKEIYRLSLNYGYQTRLRSDYGSVDSTTDVLIIDSLGELLSFYDLSDYAFIGGSLVAVGGHNMLEAIAVGVPVFCGPFINNFKEVCESLLQAGGIKIVNDADALVKEVIGLHLNDNIKSIQVKNAAAVLMENQGALTRILSAINK